MMRQLEGSFDIAIITPFVTRFTQEHFVNLVANLDASKYEIQQRIVAMQNGFIAKATMPIKP